MNHFEQFTEDEIFHARNSLDEGVRQILELKSDPNTPSVQIRNKFGDFEENAKYLMALARLSTNPEVRYLGEEAEEIVGWLESRPLGARKWADYLDELRDHLD